MITIESQRGSRRPVDHGIGPIDREKEKSRLFLTVGQGIVKVVLDGKERKIYNVSLLWPILKLLAEGTMQKGEDGKSKGISKEDFIKGVREAGIEGSDAEVCRKALGNVKNFFDNNFGRKDMVINITKDQSGNELELISFDARGGKSKTVGYKLNADIEFIIGRSDREIKGRLAKLEKTSGTATAEKDETGKKSEGGSDAAEYKKQKDSKIGYEDVGEHRFIFSGVERLILAYFIDRYIMDENEEKKSLARLKKEGITFISGENLIRITGISIRNIKQIKENNMGTYPKDKNERGRIAADVLQRANDFGSNIVDSQRNFISKLDPEKDSELICLLNLIGKKGFMSGLITHIQSLRKDN